MRDVRKSLTENKIIKKLRQESGESIAEVLLAILVIALSLMAFVSLLQASQRMILRSEKQLAGYYEGLSGMESRAAASADDTVTAVMVTKKNNPAQQVMFRRGVALSGRIEVDSFTDRPAGGEPDISVPEVFSYAGR